MKQIPTVGVTPRPSLMAQTMSSSASRTPTDGVLRDLELVLRRPMFDARVGGRLSAPGGWKDVEADAVEKVADPVRKDRDVV